MDTHPWLSYQDTRSFESRPLPMGSDTQCQETDRCEFHLKCDGHKFEMNTLEEFQQTISEFVNSDCLNEFSTTNRNEFSESELLKTKRY